MKILAVASGLWRGGAQEATIEMLRLLKARGVDINVLISNSAEGSFRSDIENLDIPTFSVPGKTVANYPDLAMEDHAELIKSSDLVWITDIEYLAASRIKRIKRDVPVIAHLHSYALACPIQTAFYGMRETCTENCSHSLQRFAQCKQLSRRYRKLWGQRKTPIKVYELLNLPKSFVDFTSWPMNEEIVGSIDGFVAVSDFTRALMRTHLPQLNHVPVEVVTNPVMMPELALAPKNQKKRRRESILYASGAIIHKGPHLALYALRKLLDEGSKEFTLTMLDTENDVWIKSIVKHLRLEKHVNLLGRVPSRKEVFALMADSTVALLPSIWPEPFGRIPVEANLLGTPAIVSNRGGLPDTIVDKVTGLVTEPKVEAITKALNEALEREWNRELIARTAAQRFEPERIIDYFIRFLKEFI